MTAEELQKFVAEKSREGTGKNWTLFEVICSGELGKIWFSDVEFPFL